MIFRRTFLWSGSCKSKCNYLESRVIDMSAKMNSYRHIKKGEIRMKRIVPQGKQVEVLAIPPKGHTVVLGTAGSGKTTIALLRAENLANLPGKQEVLLVTFNRALVEYMRKISNAKTSKLTVENYHKFARGYLDGRGKMKGYGIILDSEKKQYYIEQAVECCREENPEESTLNRPVDFFVEEITFIEGFGYRRFEEYYNAARIGRASANIKRENRKWVYAVYDKYLELREENGYKYDWEDLASYAYEELQEDERPRRYSHIIVDEGQDFSPMMIRSLVQAVAPGGSFTFLGDVAQQIYGSRISWRDSGIKADKIWTLETNYRNPASIVNFARDITESEYWKQSEDMVNASFQIAEGPRPVLIEFPKRSMEIKWIVKRGVSLSQTSSVIIICRRRSTIDVLQQELRKGGCRPTEIDHDTPGFAEKKTVYLSTFHAAKGLEFDNVMIPFLSEKRFPDRESREECLDEMEMYADELKLLYVAATRCKYGLYMTYSCDVSSLFPVDSEHYDFFAQEE